MFLETPLPCGLSSEEPMTSRARLAPKPPPAIFSVDQSLPESVIFAFVLHSHHRSSEGTCVTNAWSEMGKLIKGQQALTGWSEGGGWCLLRPPVNPMCGCVTARLDSQGRTWISHNFRLSGNILAPVFSQPLNNVKIRWWDGSEGLKKKKCLL